MTEHPLDPDEETIRRIRAGEGALFEQLMRRHNRRIYRVARSIAADEAEAEDIMQETYVRAFSHLDRFEGRARFSTWLTRIAVHEALGRRRRTRTFDEVDLEAMMDETRDPEAQAAAAELAALLERTVARLPEIYRVVFVLRAVEQLSVREVSECLDLDEGTVKTRFFRARAALRDALAEHADAIAPDIYDFHLSRCDRVVAHVIERLRH